MGMGRKGVVPAVDAFPRATACVDRLDLACVDDGPANQVAQSFSASIESFQHRSPGFTPVTCKQTWDTAFRVPFGILDTLALKHFAASSLQQLL